jgi:hypothetical protein
MSTVSKQGLVKLGDVLDALCLKRGDPMMHTWSLLLVYASEAMMDLGMRMDIGSNVVTKEIAVNEVTRRIDFPDDFIRLLKIGFRHNGNFIALGSNPKMAPLVVDGCGNYEKVKGGNSKGVAVDWNEEVEENVLDQDGFPYGLPVWNYGMVPFGAAGGWSESGYFKENRETKTIDFSSGVTIDSVLLRYESSGFKVDADNYIWAQCVPAIENYIVFAEAKWRYSTSGVSADQRIMDTMWRQYANTAINAITAIHGSTAAEMGDAYRQTKGGVPRA